MASKDDRVLVVGVPIQRGEFLMLRVQLLLLVQEQWLAVLREPQSLWLQRLQVP